MMLETYLFFTCKRTGIFARNGAFCFRVTRGHLERQQKSKWSRRDIHLVAEWAIRARATNSLLFARAHPPEIHVLLQHRFVPLLPTVTLCLNFCNYHLYNVKLWFEMYKTRMLPAVLNDNETWFLTFREERRLTIRVYTEANIWALKGWE